MNARLVGHLCFIGFCLCLCDHASAQRGGIRGRPALSGFTIARDREAEAWLKKAADARAAADWKLLCDTLFRLVDQHSGSTVADPPGGAEDPETTEYEPVSLAAWRLLKSCPPEALAAYRLTYQAEAARALELARANRDESRLRQIISRYLPTRAGAETADVLATWLADEGRWSEVLRVLDQLEMFGDHGVPAWSIELRRAAALAGMGQAQAVTEAVARLREKKPEGAPTDWTERLSQIESIASSPGAISGSVAVDGWPYLLGSGLSSGRMGAVAPRVAFESPVRVSLAGAEYVDRDAASEVAADGHRAPVWQAVCDGQTLFVATPTGFSALDPISMAPRWTPMTLAEKVGRQAPPIRTGMAFWNQTARPAIKADSATQRAVFDELAGSLAVFDGMVFCIEQSAIEVSVQNQVGSEDDLIANTLSAFDAATGKLLWQKGHAGPIDDGLTGAHFVAPPINAGKQIVALYQMGPDLTLLALNTAGQIVKRVPLGSMTGTSIAGRQMLPMAEADGELYVQTGMGVLFSLDVGDLALRWRPAKYPRASRAVDRAQPFMIAEFEPRPDEWLASPPILTRELVILAPTDSSRLHAYKRASGEKKWTSQRRGRRYLIGADERHVYAFGEDVCAYSLKDGEVAWKYQDASVTVTGRPILSGNRLLVPTRGGLLSLNPISGEKLALEPMNADGGSLGNLFAWDGALLSVEFNALRRFGDPSHELAEAQRQLAKNPSDEQWRMKAATLLLMQKEFVEALRVLDEGKGDASASGTDDLDHLRVAALLGEARSILTSDSGTEKLAGLDSALQRAQRLASRPGDAVSTALTHATLSERMGSPKDAVLHLVQPLREFARTAVELPDGRRLRAGLLIQQHLERYWKELDAAQRSEIVGVLRTAARETSEHRAATTALADALGCCELGAQIDLALGRSELEQGMPESAEFYLRRAAARPADATVSIEAGIRTVELLRDAKIWRVPRYRAAKPYLEKLATFPPESRIPADILADQSEPTLAEYLEQRRGGAAAPRAFPTGDASNELRKGENINDQGAIVSAFAWPGSAADEIQKYTAICMYTMPPASVVDTLAGIDLGGRGDSRRAWQADLLPNAADENYSLMNNRTERIYSDPVAIGSTAAIPTEKGVFLVGLGTGQVLCRPMMPPAGRESKMPRTSVVAAGGIFVVAIDPRTLAGIPPRNQTSPLWRLTLGAPQLSDIVAVDDRVVAVSMNEGTLWVIDPSDGHVERQIDLRGVRDGGQDDDMVRGPALAFAGFRAVTARGRTVSGWSIRDGKRSWTRRLSGTIKGVQALDSKHVGISEDDTFHVVAAVDGQDAGSVVVRSAILPPLDAAVVAENRMALVVLNDESPPEIKMEWYNMESGKRLKLQGPWKAVSATNRPVTRQMLRTSADIIPVAEPVMHAPEEINRAILAAQLRRQQQPQAVPAGLQVLKTTRVKLFERRTGNVVGGQITVGSSDETNGLTAAPQVLDIIVRDDRLLVVTATGRQPIGLFGESP